MPYIAPLIFQLNNRIINNSTKYITNINAMIVLSGRCYYYNYCYKVCILSNIRLWARIDRSVVLSQSHIQECLHALYVDFPLLSSFFSSFKNVIVTPLFFAYDLTAPLTTSYGLSARTL